jgi:hypothetical protein
LSEDPAVGVEPGALDCRVAPVCPSGVIPSLDAPGDIKSILAIKGLM